MTPRPLYRSLVLWSGVIVMGFLVWAWWVSYHHLSIAYYGRVEATHAAGGLALVMPAVSLPPGVYHQEGPIKIRDGEHGERIYDRARPDDPAAVFPPVRTYSDGSEIPASIFLPHWLVLLVFAVVWLPGLVILQRRKSRVLTG